MKSLLLKDFRNAQHSFSASLFLGVALCLVIKFQSEATDLFIPWSSAFWLTFFFSSTSLFFRTFAFEQDSKNFLIYQTLQIPRWKIFASQSLIHFFSLIVLALAYWFLCLFFWSASDPEALSHFLIILLVSFGLAPVGTVLGLMLQLEREFLFSVTYFPLATPIILGAHELFHAGNTIWYSILGIFCLSMAYLGALAFEFFFDELT